MTKPAVYSISQIADLLGAEKAFAGMPKPLTIQIAEVMVMRPFKQGDVIAQEGTENPGQLILVVSGEAEVSAKVMGRSTKQIYRRAVPGHILGEVGFIDGGKHSASCIALTDLHVAVLERSELVVMLNTNPSTAAQLMAGLLRLLARRIRHANITMRAQSLENLKLKKELEKLRK